FNLVDGRPVADREPPLPKNRMAYNIRKTFASRSHLYVLFKLWLDTLETPEEGASAPLEAEDVFARSPSPRVVRGWELTLALLDELRARVEAGGGRFAVVLFPTRYQVDDALWAAGVLRKRLDTDAYDLRAPQKRLGAWAEATGAVLIDLLDEFRSRNTSNSFYYEVDAHWNPAGHRLAAELILDGLVERGLLAVPPTSSTPDP
ncbi:MAG TPA: hypothetical protein VFP98_00860, partial [Candidatus Polarisedimenticolia bacterium]|nr:hypothetical protein [Candidatus Polarisedimenticolia bacterium]